MSRRQRLSAVSVGALVLFALLAIAPGVGFTQHVAVAMPENAVAKNYGSGWECAPGYRKGSGVCTAVEVPAHAFPTNTSYGRGWECDRGYRKAGNACAAITVPPNSYLNSFGDGWECNRGFQQVEDACVAITVPANAYLASRRSDVVGSVIEDIRRSTRRAWLSQCPRTVIRGEFVRTWMEMRSRISGRGHGLCRRHNAEERSPQFFRKRLGMRPADVEGRGRLRPPVVRPAQPGRRRTNAVEFRAAKMSN